MNCALEGFPKPCYIQYMLKMVHNVLQLYSSSGCGCACCILFNGYVIILFFFFAISICWSHTSFLSDLVCFPILIVSSEVLMLPL